MTKDNLGLLHPGAMGATIGASAVASGHNVFWVSKDRSEASTKRANNAGLQACSTLAEMTGRCQHILSVCPPHAAADLAREVMSHHYAGTYIDCNAISPQSALEVQNIVESSGAAQYVDGGIIGPPAQRAGSTRLYLSGTNAEPVAGCFSDGLLPAIVISENPTEASALKMAYAAYTKGHSALLLATRAMARGYGVENNLLEEWAISQPTLASLCDSEGITAARKGWRFAGEMREIVKTMDQATLPAGFHQAAAQLYDRCENFKNSDGSLTIDEVINQILSV